MDVTATLNALIANATSNQVTLDALIAQLQHTTISSSDDELYEAPTINETTGLWTLSQSTANVDGMYVGCYKLPTTGIDSYISSVTVISHSNPASPAFPATITPSVGSPIDLTDVTDLEGQAFNSFCIRSATAFEITLRISQWLSICVPHVNVAVGDSDITYDILPTDVDEDGNCIYVLNSGHYGLSGLNYQTVYMAFGNGTFYDLNACAYIYVDSVVVTGATVSRFYSTCVTGNLNSLAHDGCYIQAGYQTANNNNTPFTVTIKIKACP